MLDAGMAEFETEMQAKARAQPRRASTRRNAETDPSSPAGAAEIGRRIAQFWTDAATTSRSRSSAPAEPASGRFSAFAVT